MQRPSMKKIGQIAGIDIRLHYSWLLMAVLLAGSFIAYFYEMHANWPPLVIWSTAILICLLFFISILLHEFSHVLVAKVFGIPIRHITLFALGGVSHIEKNAAAPAAEFWMGVAGPIMSSAIGWACAWAAAWWDKGATPMLPMLLSPPVSVLASLSSLNFMLALFNLIPGFPLDGGRLLRAAVWWLNGDGDRAARISARMGQSVAFGLFALGVWEFISSDGVAGVWLVFLGWFLLDAATASYAPIGTLAALRGVLVGDVMSNDCKTIASDTSIQRFADEYILKTGDRCYVVEERGAITGLITLADLKDVERSRWDETTVDTAKRSLHQLRSVSRETPVVEALETMGRADVNQLPVMSAGRIEGVLSRSHIMHLLQRRAEFSM
jgi:Zn-dependent protease/CBS domain-containing protein